MIDAVTSDEDKVAPVYKLEEISQLLRSSNSSIVKEVSEFILKRLDHKSPVVKQKALRLIKYAVGKSGVEFRREMQRNSVAVRQLFHYKGQPDPLKGDALNKAVRDTAREAISSIFSEENSKPAPAEDLNKRIQGFGNTNFEAPSEDKKSFITEVVGLGSASIKQGISSFTQGHSLKKSDNGSYKSPNLRRSLTSETSYSDRYEPVKLNNDTQSKFGISKDISSGPWSGDSRVGRSGTESGDSSASYAGSKTREEKLLETIVTSGGVRLNPTRDAIQVFLVEAAKLDALALSHALESKLQSPMWQVRVKAVCVLESILRKKEDEHFATIASYFSENKDAVIRCSESPQSSLREKANKVLSLFDGGQRSGFGGGSEKVVKADTAVVHMPDLIDTGGPDDYFGTEDSAKRPTPEKVANSAATETALIDDLFGESLGTTVSNSELKNVDDPFADVSFHTNEDRESGDDLFSSFSVDDKLADDKSSAAANKSEHELFDMFGSSSELKPEEEKHREPINDLMATLSLGENSTKMEPKGNYSQTVAENMFPTSNFHASGQTSDNAFTGMLGTQTAGMNTNPIFPLGMPYNIPPGLFLNPSFTSQPINYAAMSNLLAQQQFLATMSNFQHLGSPNAQNTGSNQATGSSRGSAPIPDIFQSNFPGHAPSSVMNNSKKEETRAFDFISDHLASARDQRRVA